MTPEEALARIQAAGKCFVVFDAETGEVLDVQPQTVPVTADGIATAMHTAARTHGSVKGRYLDGADVTLETLTGEVAEARFVQGRVAIFSRWATLAPAELVGVLETDPFAPPMDTFRGPHVVIEILFAHPPDVLRPLVPRLERIDRGFEEAVQRLLASRLAVLAGDFARLRAAWEQFDQKTFEGLIWHPELIQCIGDLRPRDPAVIELLIATVSSAEQMMFGPRREAMVSLGKIGAPAGARAAQAIRDTIFDSTPAIVALRERVLARIETAESAWTGCPCCYWGKVLGEKVHGPVDCETCLGLGFVAR